MYLPAPAGPLRMMEWGRRPAAMAVRSCSMAWVLPMKSLKWAGNVIRCSSYLPRGTYCAKVFDSCELSLDL